MLAAVAVALSIAAGPSLPAVVHASETRGWPHPATKAERREVNRLAAPLTCRPMRRHDASLWFCDIVVLRVWEDGSFRWVTPPDLH